MKTIRSALQHELNSLHVFCRLCGIFGRRRATAIAKAWERCFLYRVIYA